MLGLTGASGAPYAARVLRALVASGADVGVVVSRAALRAVSESLLKNPVEIGLYEKRA